jgi:hypothetical protein
LHGFGVTDTLSLTVRSFWPSRAVVVRTGVVCVAFAAWPNSVYAQSSTNRALDKARSAWDEADFDLAPALYETALEVGGLAKADVVDAYARIGSALAIGGKKKAAIEAFRKAAVLDPNFQVPPEAGKRATTLAKAAKRLQARAGSLSLTLEVADEVDSGAPFGVDVKVSPRHPPLVDTLSFSARDPLAGHAYERTAPFDALVHFDVPTRMTLPDATLVVQVRAHDTHDNELWVGEKRVHVAKPLPAPEPAPIAALEPAPRPRHKEQPTTSAGGFWHTAWPYIIGGVALAAGGAATWYATRPTDNVYVGQVKVELH